MNIIVYSTPTCPYCKLVKKYFTDKKIPFVEYDVSGDQIKLEEMISKSGQMGVPVVDVNGTIITGFDKLAIDEALKKPAVKSKPKTVKK